ncbi:pimeloyl-ACP methyl ester carboxylesterase [Paraburkholderia sp. CI2]|uniref:alpha/beta fold hydrolase n=1 Tax=Paraburkholderia sp. CI2 TaxID=2723093 RepID=UPI00161989DD|nr:alpha/beta hydrolase [Paraburkholderia sp. CI2]MBB5468136.1 pimeloyl-ACP methyl ester carboxylesterase [Paraburkholderia sp. CI2]
MTKTIRCQWDSGEIALDVDEAGSGASVVLLPALSTISTRLEMRPLLDLLAPQFHVTTVDWPGFGDQARPKEEWSPELLSEFLNWFLSDIVAPPHAIVAAGHAATYALYQAVLRSDTVDRLVLIAPTWRGPLPTMMGGQRAWFSRVRSAIVHPLAGPLLYRLNVSRHVITMMAREHVYSDPDWLGGDRLAAKLAVTRAPGARHSSVRFVTGALDRVANRAAFLDLARRANIPILVIYGDQTPPKSRVEMEALGQLPNVQVEWVMKGKLAIHEEFPEIVSIAIRRFLTKESPL